MAEVRRDPTARMTAARPTPTVRVRKPVLATDPPTPTVRAILAFLATAASTPTAGRGVIARRRQRPPVGAQPISALVTTVTPRRTCVSTTATARVNPYRPASTRPLQATGHVRVTGRRFETRSDCATPAGHELSFWRDAPSPACCRTGRCSGRGCAPPLNGSIVRQTNGGSIRHVIRSHVDPFRCGSDARLCDVARALASRLRTASRRPRGSQTAIRIAEAVWIRIYGEKRHLATTGGPGHSHRGDPARRCRGLTPRRWTATCRASCVVASQDVGRPV